MSRPATEQRGRKKPIPRPKYELDEHGRPVIVGYWNSGFAKEPEIPASVRQFFHLTRKHNKLLETPIEQKEGSA